MLKLPLFAQLPKLRVGKQHPPMLVLPIPPGSTQRRLRAIVPRRLIQGLRQRGLRGLQLAM